MCISAALQPGRLRRQAPVLLYWCDAPPFFFVLPFWSIPPVLRRCGTICQLWIASALLTCKPHVSHILPRRRRHEPFEALSRSLYDSSMRSPFSRHGINILACLLISPDGIVPRDKPRAWSAAPLLLHWGSPCALCCGRFLIPMSSTDLRINTDEVGDHCKFGRVSELIHHRRSHAIRRVLRPYCLCLSEWRVYR